MKKVVVIGGGSGIFNVLKGLKNYPVDITSIVTTFDNGGSTGILRDEFGTLPQGDIRRSLVALTPDTKDSILRDMFNFRFPKDSSLHGHSFGNLFLQALISITGSEVGAIKKASDILNIKHKILPVSTDNAQLYAELENGSTIKGETNIDIPKHDGNVKIKKLYLEPKAVIFNEARDAICDADLVIIGPGDLYTSIIPNMLTEGFTEAINKNNGKVLYILNIMTKWGETNGFIASNFVKKILPYMGKRKIDYVLCNNAKLNPSLVKKYKEENSEPVIIDTEELEKYVNKIIEEDLIVQKYSDKIIDENLIIQAEIVRHDPQKISSVIMKLL